MQEQLRIGQTVRALRSLPPNLLEGEHYPVVHVLPEYSGDGVYMARHCYRSGQGRAQSVCPRPPIRLGALARRRCNHGLPF